MSAKPAEPVPSGPATEEPPVAAREPEPVAVAVAEELVEDDLLVEDVSIDGMCGVY